MSTRTVQAAPIKSKFSDRWACVFQVFRSHNGDEYLAGQLETSALWFDAEAALKAGRRAMEVLEQTGKWPNMCELW